MSGSTSWHAQHDPSAQRPPNQLDDLIAGQPLAELKRRRREVPTAVALIVLGVAGAAFGRGAPLPTFIAVWMAGAGVLFLVGRGLRDRQERGDGPRGRLVSGEVRGEPATVLRRSTAREWVAAGFIAYLGLFFFGSGWFALGEGRTTGALVPLGILLLPFVVAAIRRLVRARRSGVWLTPTSLLVREGGTSYRTGWDDVAGVSQSTSSTDLVVVLPRTMAALTVTGRDRGARAGVTLGDIPIATGALPVDAYALVDLLWHYRASENRPELGTAAAPTTVRRIQAARG
ncbi:hypothetical protein [Cellulomonas hominis]|uniref:hypothetical protein n=1 Tax=Cellulomonas hominis TaxID=156981 RepID=UPI001B982F8F|nr:hypothetical protein [Cellulomonas hominis]VTR76654.1 hypothetical protein CHMI_01416 [Cellulomonas hominis]